MMECLCFQPSFLFAVFQRCNIFETSCPHSEKMSPCRTEFGIWNSLPIGLRASPEREIDMKRIANDEHRALADKHSQQQMQARKQRLRKEAMRLMLFGAAWRNTNKSTNTFLFLDRKHQPSWLRCVCDSALWKGIMLMPWPLDVDVFAILKGLFLFPPHFTLAHNLLAF